MQEQESGWYGKLLQSGGDLMQVKSTIKLNMPRINQLTRAAVVALEQTAEALHTEVVQAQVMPFDTGNLQNESTFVDTSEASNGKVSLVSSTPYARRLYYHPEYQFQKYENLLQAVNGLSHGFREVSAPVFAGKPLRSFIKRRVVYDAAVNGHTRLDHFSWNCRREPCLYR